MTGQKILDRTTLVVAMVRRFPAIISKMKLGSDAIVSD